MIAKVTAIVLRGVELAIVTAEEDLAAGRRATRADVKALRSARIWLDGAKRQLRKGTR